MAVARTPSRFTARLQMGLCGAIIATLVAGGAARAQDEAGDPAMGQRLFLQCRACHTVGPQDPSGVGPNLYGVVGAKAGAKNDYDYSPALRSSGLVWTPEALDAWLKKPTSVAPGTKMAYAGLGVAKMRQDLIAYLATLGGNPSVAAPCSGCAN